MAIYFFIFSFERTFKTIYIILFYRFFISCLLLQIFWSKGMKCPPSSIFVDMHVTSQQGSRNIFIYTTTNHFALKTFKTTTNQHLVSNEYFYMVNSCCDATKTTVNDIKNVSKMADISLLQVKIFQELNKIWKIGERSYIVSKVLSNEKIKIYIAISL
jgi:hypothetical protein